jgi:excisionase family DNA binding protein
MARGNMERHTATSRNVTTLGHSIENICEALGVSKGFVRDQIRRGHLRACRMGRRVIVLEEDLRAYLETCRTGAGKVAESKSV